MRAPGTGVLLAYEKTGYDTKDDSRLPDLLPDWSVRRLAAAGADAIKLLLYYNADHPARINDVKQAFLERIGDECAANDIPFFLEPVAYDDALGDAKGIEFAKAKPSYVMAYMEEFSKPQYGVDILKVEVPVNMIYVEGVSVFGGQKAYSRKEAADLFREAAGLCQEALHLPERRRHRRCLPRDAGAGRRGRHPLLRRALRRATWQDGIPVYAKQGYDALVAWLEDRGVKNIKALNEVLAKGAKPWWDFYGGKGQIEVI